MSTTSTEIKLESKIMHIFYGFLDFLVKVAKSTLEYLLNTEFLVVR